MLIIKTWKDPYDVGFTVCKEKEMIFNPGLTVLVGCNGSGKTTTLRNIEEECKEMKVPCHLYDNLSKGRNSSFDDYFSGFGTDKDFEDGIKIFLSSEGESIGINVSKQGRLYKEFFKEGIIKDASYRFEEIFDFKHHKGVLDNRRVLLFDAVDSGLSVDMVIEMKEYFKKVIEGAQINEYELYIIASANEYELCSRESCFDVTTGKYITFEDYSEYKNFILNSRTKKVKRLKKQAKWYEKEVEKEKEKYKELKEKAVFKAKEIIEDDNKKKNIKWEVSRAFDAVKEYVRGCRSYEIKNDIERTIDEFIKEYEREE